MRKSLSLAAALALLLVFIVPTFAQWSTGATADAAVGMGGLGLAIDGHLDLTLVGCEQEGEDRCSPASGSVITVRNTGSLPVRVAMALERSTETCPSPAFDVSMRSHDVLLFSGPLCDLEGLRLDLADGLDPGAVVEVELSVEAPAPEGGEATDTDLPPEYSGLLRFSATQWNLDSGWSHTVARPIAITWAEPAPELDEPPEVAPEDPPESEPDDDADSESPPEEAQPPDDVDPPATDDPDKQPPPPGDDPDQPDRPDDPPPVRPDDTTDPAITPPSTEHNTASISGIVRVDGVNTGASLAGYGDVDAESGATTVSIHDLDRSLLASTTIDGAGYYVFEDLEFGEYVIGFVAPNGFTFLTSDEQTAGDTAVMELDYVEGDDETTEVWGWTPPLLLDIDTPRLTAIDAIVVPRADEHAPEEPPEPDEFEAEQLFEISGTVWFDDGDGMRIDPPDPIEGQLNDADDVEEPLEPEERASEVAVTLFDTHDYIIAETFTDSNGVYVFSNVPEGTYRVEFTAPDGFMFIAGTGDAAHDDEHDSDIEEVRTDVHDTAPPTFHGASTVILIDDDIAVDAALAEAPPWEPPGDDGSADVAPVAPVTPATEPENVYAVEPEGGDR